MFPFFLDADIKYHEEQNNILQQQNTALKEAISQCNTQYISLIQEQRVLQHKLYRLNEYNRDTHIQNQIELLKKFHDAKANMLKYLD